MFAVNKGSLNFKITKHMKEENIVPICVGKPIYIRVNNKNNSLLNSFNLLKEPELTSTPKLTPTQIMNDSIENEMTRSFLENFFNRGSIDKTNETIVKDSLQIISEKIKNQDENLPTEKTNNFLNFIFDSQPKKSLSISFEIVKKSPKNETMSDISNIISYLGNLKLKNKLNLKVVNNYIDLYRTFSDSKVKYYLDKRSLVIDCVCIKNAIGCCLQGFHENFIKNDSINNNFDKCCGDCTNFEFYHYRAVPNQQNLYNLSNLELNKFETEEPDWFKDLMDLKFTKYDFINDSLLVHNMLRTPNAHEFLIKLDESKCDCLKRTIKCCIEKIYEMLKMNESQQNLKDLLDYTCCNGCFKNEKEHQVTKATRSIFVLNHNSSSSFDDDDDDINQENIQDISLNTVDKMNEIQIKNDSINQEAAISSTVQETELNKTNSDVIEKDTEELDKSTSTIIDMLFDSNSKPKKSGNDIKSSEESNKSNESIKNVTKESENITINNQVSNDKTKKSVSNSLVKSPVLPKKSSLKIRQRNRKVELNMYKPKTVTFYDEKHGFTLVPIPEWSDSLREPVYSKSKIFSTEWKPEIIKNEYELTKLRITNSM